MNLIELLRAVAQAVAAVVVRRDPEAMQVVLGSAVNAPTRSPV
jgi:hypothetical protein